MGNKSSVCHAHRHHEQEQRRKHSSSREASHYCENPLASDNNYQYESIVDVKYESQKQVREDAHSTKKFSCDHCRTFINEQVQYLDCTCVYHNKCLIEIILAQINQGQQCYICESHGRILGYQNLKKISLKLNDQDWYYCQRCNESYFNCQTSCKLCKSQAFVRKFSF